MQHQALLLYLSKRIALKPTIPKYGQSANSLSMNITVKNIILRMTDDDQFEKNPVRSSNIDVIFTILCQTFSEAMLQNLKH